MEPSPTKLTESPNVESSYSSGSSCHEGESETGDEEGRLEEKEESENPSTANDYKPTNGSKSFVFGSAAKSLVSFSAVANDVKQVNFAEVVGKDVKKDEFSKFEQVIVTTGEEGEVCKFSSKIRLFEFDPADKSWKDRGPANLKVNEMDSKSRLIIRSEYVLKLLVNVWTSAIIDVSLIQKRGVQIIFKDAEKVVNLLLRMSTNDDSEKLIPILKNSPNGNNKC